MHSDAFGCIRMHSMHSDACEASDNECHKFGIRLCSSYTSMDGTFTVRTHGSYNAAQTETALLDCHHVHKDVLAADICFLQRFVQCSRKP